MTAQNYTQSRKTMDKQINIQKGDVGNGGKLNTANMRGRNGRRNGFVDDSRSRFLRTTFFTKLHCFLFRDVISVILMKLYGVPKSQDSKISCISIKVCIGQ